MKIIVTGGLGYIGSHIILELVKQGHTVYSIDNNCRSIKNATDTIGQMTNVYVKNYEIDLSKEIALSDQFNGVDCIIHCAGYKSVGESKQFPQLYYKNNIDSTLNVLKMMEIYNIKNLIFSSSCTVYGSHLHSVNEHTKTGNCESPYGWSKWMQEQMFKDVCIAHPDYAIISLRYFNPIGSYTYLSDISKTNLLPCILDAMYGRIDKLKVFGHDYVTRDGTCVRDYIHVEDLARAHVGMVDYINKLRGFDVFNVGTGIGFTVLDVISKFEEVNQVKINWQFTDRRQGDAAIAYSQSNKIRHAINWKPKYNLADMVNLQI